jgi:hypothetical protein
VAHPAETCSASEFVGGLGWLAAGLLASRSACGSHVSRLASTPSVSLPHRRAARRLGATAATARQERKGRVGAKTTQRQRRQTTAVRRIAGERPPQQP